MKPLAHVLVVDDDVFMREVLQRLLVQAGMSVLTYASGSALLEQADLQAPAVLLLDVKMPGMSGLELQTALRERGVNLPIVFLTGASNVAMAVTAMRNGAVDFIEKPFDGAALVARVIQTYARHVEFGATGGTDEHVVNAEHSLRLASLTPREREVLDLMVTGRTSKMIARELGGSFRTIEIHRGRVIHKMAAASLADLVRMTLQAHPVGTLTGP